MTGRPVIRVITSGYDQLLWRESSDHPNIYLPSKLGQANVQRLEARSLLSASPFKKPVTHKLFTNNSPLKF